MMAGAFFAGESFKTPSCETEIAVLRMSLQYIVPAIEIMKTSEESDMAVFTELPLFLSIMEADAIITPIQKEHMASIAHSKFESSPKKTSAKLRFFSGVPESFDMAEMFATVSGERGFKYRARS